MKIIRKGIFETNSSSTHALVISHNVDPDNYSTYDSLDNNYEFGREECRIVDHWDEKLAYTYQVLIDYRDRYEKYLNKEDNGYAQNYKVTDEDLKSFKDKINKIFKELNDEDFRSKIYPDDIFNLIELNADDEKSWYWDKPDELVVQNEDDSYSVIVALGKGHSLKEDYEGKIYISYYDEDRNNIIREPNSDEIEVREATDKDILRYKLIEKFGKDSWSHKVKDVYVDHTEDFGDNGFISAMLNASEDYLKRWIFSHDSYITVGGDEYRGYNIKTIGFKYDYDSSKEYQVNEKGERCPDSNQFEDFDEWWEIQKHYPIMKDDGGFWDKLEQYKKDHDVFLKGC